MLTKCCDVRPLAESRPANRDHAGIVMLAESVRLEVWGSYDTDKLIDRYQDMANSNPKLVSARGSESMNE